MDCQVPWESFQKCGFLRVLERGTLVTEEFVLAPQQLLVTEVLDTIGQANIRLRDMDTEVDLDLIPLGNGLAVATDGPRCLNAEHLFLQDGWVFLLIVVALLLLELLD